jgi:hypothetical protein
VFFSAAANRYVSPVLALLAALSACRQHRVEPAGSIGGPVDLAVEVSVAVSETPPAITLRWPDRHAGGFRYTGYAIHRRDPSSASWGPPIALLTGDATSYTDSAVRLGVRYEYKLVRQAVSPTGEAFKGYGFTLSAIHAPLVESRGTIILLVEKRLALPLDAGLRTLEQDLAGDGWTVLRHDLDGRLKDSAVKRIVESDYLENPGQTKAVFLLGHVAVPYSGDICPDGHCRPANHQGAWPADVFYGDMSGTWTDEYVETTACLAANRNVPGDGRWDQDRTPGEVELQVGRVDSSGLTAYAGRDEFAMLRQYLRKDHLYRHGLQPYDAVPPRFLLHANYREHHSPRPYAMSLLAAASLLGPGTVDVGDWMATLPNRGHLWASGFSYGSFEEVGGLITTRQALTTELKVVFSQILGSYSGDWNSSDNVLRSLIAAPGYCLAAVWGSPLWYFHPMGLGETIGAAARLVQNNRGAYPSVFLSPRAGYALGAVHIALMGDPTLRLFPIKPPSNLVADLSRRGTRLRWSASPDRVLGYHAYRAAETSGPFERINDGLITGTEFTDLKSGNHTHVYMVRAVKLQVTGSGTYVDASEGVFTINTRCSSPSGPGNR